MIHRALGEAERHVVSGNQRSELRDALALGLGFCLGLLPCGLALFLGFPARFVCLPLGLGSFAEQLVEASGVEVRGRRVVPRRELELGSFDREDGVERDQWIFFAEHRRDHATTGDAKGTDAIACADLELAGLLRLPEQVQDRAQRKVLDISAQRHRSATSVALSNTCSFFRLKPTRIAAPGFVCVSVESRATNVFPSADS